MNSGILVHTYYMNVQIHTKAIELRRMGHSYAEIAKVLKVSRSAVCNWVKNLKLNDEEKIQLEKRRTARQGRGRLQASMTLRTRTVFKQKVAYESAEKEFALNIKDPFFTLGLGLTGLKKRSKGGALSFQFSTTNPQDMNVMLKWLEKYLGITRMNLAFRLFVATSPPIHDFVSIWAQNLRIPQEQFYKTVVSSPLRDKGDREYVGSLCVSLSRVDLIRKILAWQKLTIMYYI